jgi:hypothetical protein
MRQALDKADRLLAQSVDVVNTNADPALSRLATRALPPTRTGAAASAASSGDGSRDSGALVTWKSTGIDQFVAEAIAEVRERACAALVVAYSASRARILQK